MQGIRPGHTPRCSRRARDQTTDQIAEEVGAQAIRRECPLYPGPGLPSPHRDLQQAKPDSREFSAGQKFVLWNGVTDHAHQPISICVQYQPHLIGERRTATGPVGGRLALVPLDQIFSPPSRAVNVFIQTSRGSLDQVDDNIGDIRAFLRRVDPRQNPARTGPEFRGVTCRGEAAHLFQLPDRTAEANIIRFDEDLFGQGFVGAEAEDVFDAVVIAPIHRLLPAIMAVTPNCDDDIWPVHADTANQPADMSTHLFANWCFVFTQDGDHAKAAHRAVYMDRRKTSFIVMSVE